MSSALELLKQANAAIRAFDPEKATSLLEDFQKANANSKLAPELVNACTTQLNEIKAFSAAARDGVGLARDELRELLRLSQSLDTYDSKGTRLQRTRPTPIIGKF